MSDDRTRPSYQCGHIARPPRFRGDVEARERQLIAFKGRVGTQLCRSCFKTQHAAENAAAAIANQKRGLPRLRGTQEKIAWAEKLRLDFVDELELSDADARAACGACLDASMWIHLSKTRGFKGRALLGEFQRWGKVMVENLQAGLPDLEAVGVDDSMLPLIEDKRLLLRLVGTELGIERDALLGAMAKIKTEVDWLELLPLPEELALALLLHQPAFVTYLWLKRRRELVDEKELMRDE